jgi:hypothetical protein
VLTADKIPPIATQSPPEHRTVEFENTQSVKVVFPERTDTAPPRAWLKSPAADTDDRTDRISANRLLLDAAIPKIEADALLFLPFDVTSKSCASTFFTVRQATSSKYATPPKTKQF